MTFIQKLTHRDKVDRCKVFRLFSSQYRQIRYVRPFLECMWMVLAVADLYHICVFLCCRTCWANKKVFRDF